MSHKSILTGNTGNLANTNQGFTSKAKGVRVYYSGVLGTAQVVMLIYGPTSGQAPSRTVLPFSVAQGSSFIPLVDGEVFDFAVETVDGTTNFNLWYSE